MTDFNQDYRLIDGEWFMSTPVLAILVGVADDEVRAEIERQRASGATGLTIPRAWRRNAAELRARLGTDDADEIVRLVRAERQAADPKEPA